MNLLAKLGAVVTLAYLAFTGYVYTRYQVENYLADPTEEELVEGVGRSIGIAVLPPEQVAKECGGEGTLGCTFRMSEDVCLLILPELPEDGRSPYLSDTGFLLIERMAIWGHELAHCVGIDIHGDRS